MREEPGGTASTAPGRGRTDGQREPSNSPRERTDDWPERTDGLREELADAYLSARAAGPVTPLSPAEIASWRTASGELLPRLWQHLRGQANPRNAPLR